MRRGLAYGEMFRYRKAFVDLTLAIQLDPRPDRYAYRGLIGIICRKNLAGARRDLDRSIKTDASQRRAWNFRAVADMMENKDDEACSDFKTGCANGDGASCNAAEREEICR
jgi:tetratricopeptide (TPR) repeat protein